MTLTTESTEFTAAAEAVAAMTTSRPPGHGAVRAYDWIAHHAANRPRKEAIRDLGTGRCFTYADLDARADAMAAWLTRASIGRGDRVAVLAHNGVEFFDIQFACLRTGAICVLLNWRLTASELEYIVNDSAPKALVHDAVFADTASALQARCGIATTLAIDGGTPSSPYERALAGAGSAPPRPVLTHDDVVTIMYTSGTTGRPKGAQITYGMNFWDCVNRGIPSCIPPDPVHLNVLPLFHTGGLSCYSNPVLHAGGTVVIQKHFDRPQPCRCWAIRRRASRTSSPCPRPTSS